MSPRSNFLDNTYLLLLQLGQGGTATVHFATVDLDAFDYAKLYSYTQVQGKTHAERIALSEVFAVRLRQTTLDRTTMQAILKAHKIPLPGDHVAVKLANSGVDPVRFENEWKYLICLYHPNVIQVYGGGTSNGQPYYAMEVLRPVIDHHTILKALDLQERISAVLQAAKGLSYLHGVGILHLDVKPGNILFYRDEKGTIGAKVMDLGCAIPFDDQTTTTHSKITGTPHYMAPEQVMSPVETDVRTDVYAIGSTLLFCTTGRLPRAGQGTPRELIRVIRERRPIDAANIHDPNIPMALAGIIDKAVRMDPVERYQTMGEFIEDLEALLAQIGPSLKGQMSFISGCYPDIPTAGFIFSRKPNQEQVASYLQIDPTKLKSEALPKRKLLASGPVLVALGLTLAAVVLLLFTNRIMTFLGLGMESETPAALEIPEQPP